MRSALGYPKAWRFFKAHPKGERAVGWKMHEPTRWQQDLVQQESPLLIKTQVMTFTGVKSKHCSRFQLLDKWPAIVPESTTHSHLALLEGDHGIATSAEIIKGTRLHAGLYVQWTWLNGKDQNMWIILNTFKCDSTPIVYPWEGGKKWRKILMYIYFSPTYYFVFLCLRNQVTLATMSIQGWSQREVSNQSSPKHSNIPYRAECQF